jgi:hypothetical protein
MEAALAITGGRHHVLLRRQDLDEHLRQGRIVLDQQYRMSVKVDLGASDTSGAHEREAKQPVPFDKLGASFLVLVDRLGPRANILSSSNLGEVDRLFRA